MKKFYFFSFFALLFFIGSGLTFAAEIGDNIKIGSNQQSAKFPQLTYCSEQDKILMVWNGNDSGTDQIFFKFLTHSEVSQNPSAPGMQLSSGSSPWNRYSERPRAAYDAFSATAAVVWQESNAVGKDSVVMAILDVNTESKLTEVVVAANSSWNMTATVASDNNGSFLVAYYDSASTNITAKLFDANGAQSGSDVILGTVAGGYMFPYSIDIAYNSENEIFLVTWADYNSNLFSRTLNSDGTAGELNVYNSIQGVANPSVAYNDSLNIFLIAYDDFAGNVSAQLTDSLGILSGSLFTFGSSSALEAEPDVAYNAKNNGFAVTWSDYLGGSGVWVQEILVSSCTVLVDSVKMDKISATTNSSSVAYDAVNDSYWVAWYGESGGAKDELFLQRYRSENISIKANCKDITVYLDENGEYVLSAEDVDNGSFLLCGHVQMDIDVDEALTCAVTQPVEVRLTASDGDEQTDYCVATVTVLDTVPPVPVCENKTIFLDANGEAYLTPEDIDGGSTDNCGIQAIWLDKTDFYTADLGENTVLLTVKDNAGIERSCEAIVTVSEFIDDTPPSVRTTPLTIYLDETGTASIEPSDIDNGSFDDGEIESLSLDKSVFTCDDANRTDTMFALAPEASTGSVARFVGSQGKDWKYDGVAGSTGLGFNYGFERNLSDGQYYLIGGASEDERNLYRLDAETFSAEFITELMSSDGDEEPLDIAIDNNGYFFIVYKNGTIDKLDPVTWTAVEHANIGAGLGEVSLTYDNENERLLFVHFLQNEAVNAPNVLSEISSNGTVTELFSFFTPGNDSSCCALGIEYAGNGFCFASSAFNCDALFEIDLNNESVNLIAQPNGSSFSGLKDLIYIPANMVTLIVTDIYGNSSEGKVKVEVVDNIEPALVLNQVQVYLGPDGTYKITEQDIEAMIAGTDDNCSSSGNLEFEVYPKIFDCTMDEIVHVRVTAADASGNYTRAWTTVLVFDTLSPVFEPVADFETTVSPGTSETPIEYPEVLATDNCSVEVNLIGGLGPNGLFPVGVTTEKWVAVDDRGNSDTLMFNVTVVALNANPTINPISDVEVSESTSPITVELAGISYGNDLVEQTVAVTAKADNVDLVESIFVNYESGSTGSLEIEIASERSGVAIITVNVIDSEGGEVSETFRLTVIPVNKPPFLVYPISDQWVNASYVLKVPVSPVLGELFDDPEGDALTISAMLADGTVLPGWAELVNDSLVFNPMIENVGCIDVVVKATDIEGGSATDTFAVCVEGYPVNADAISAGGLSVNLYPNPAVDKVNISIKSSSFEPTVVTVYTITGELVLQGKFDAGQLISLDMAEHVSGVYFVKIDQNNRTVVKKLVLKGK
ncbi:Por secretion system C-terminal sorting domain-containing protein [Mariniphaga anaerophila]|uniref:Por secretion system C-terminal sorting domain-containing protein n=1 Tax=Mariniphaga anaerophila TaxID=1484053 RepID=A0A1M5ET71_9BACT|nr:T9SS type A sorting domain-containing protein [Mariniphaga anaerophila]SHF82336.1 Por secretion system C-terminal sorting domain-containing protein [Mariniphaga anaerophila]